MKNIIAVLFFTLVFAVPQVCAQGLLCDSVIKVNGKGIVTARSYYAYDVNGYQSMAKHYTFNKKTQKWAGTFWETRVYDERGNVITRKTAYWNFDTDNWIDMLIESITYDDQNRRTSIDSRRWNLERQLWIGINNEEYTYDAAGHIAQRNVGIWDDDKAAWLPSKQYKNTFDERNRVVSEEILVWHDAWVNEDKVNYEYVGNTTKVKTETHYVWDSGSWTPHSISECNSTINESTGDKRTICNVSYYVNNAWVEHSRTQVDVDMRQTEIRNRNEDKSGSTWAVTRDERAEVKYDEDGNRTFYARYRWNGGDDWMGLSRNESTYNEYGDLMTDISMHWDESTSQWRGTSNSTYDYDAVGNIILDIKCRWNIEKQAWEPLSKTTSVYDDYYSKVEETSASWSKEKNDWEVFYSGKYEYTYNAVGNVVGSREYQWEQKKWKLVQVVEYYPHTFRY